LIWFDINKILISSYKIINKNIRNNYKMGVPNSKLVKKPDTDTFVNAELKARKVYNYRVKTYDPLRHGSRELYMKQVEAEFELNCIPLYMHYGSGHSNKC
jgi:hypothetical protein